MAPDAAPNSAPPELEDLTFETDITSAENVSLDYMARIRMDFLLGQNQSMITQTQFADAKAGALLAFVGLVATRGPGAVVEASAVTPFFVAQVALHGIALICGIIVLYPRYAGLDARRQMAKSDRFSWPSLACGSMTSEGFASFMRTSQLSQMVLSIARSNHNLSQILLRKFTWLRAAFLVAVLDVAVMIARAAADGFG